MDLIKLFKKQAQASKNYIALETNNLHISYQELDKYSDQLAFLMLKRFQKPLAMMNQYAVLIKMNNSIEFVISVLATLKLGMYYIPSDIEEINTRTQEKLYGHTLFIKLVSNYNYTEQDDEMLVDYNQLKEYQDINFICVERNINDIAYIVYTSGSTGKPKGVIVEDSSLISIMHNNNYLKQLNSDIIGSISNVGFDAKAFEIWHPLLNGLVCHIIPDLYIFDTKLMSEYFDKHKITTVFLTTALFNIYAEDRNNPLLKLKQILFGGEKANISLVKKIVEANGPKIIHVYGPTEATTFSTYCSLDINILVGEHVPIGQSIPGYNIYIFDRDQLVEDGEIGELYIGGLGVARGYFQDDIMTNEKFKEIEVCGAKDRVYKTGDLVKRKNGQLIFCGRIDNQIKVRGFRIELEEIEQKIFFNFQIPNVVIFTQGVICCFYQSQLIKFKEELRNILPDYMIPDHFFQVDDFILNINRKIDRKYYQHEADLQLKSKIVDNYDLVNSKEIKTILRKIWIDILQTNNFDDNENFFDLGGKSLDVVTMKSEIGYNFPDVVHFSIIDLFTYPTINALAELLSVKPINYIPFEDNNKISDERIAIISLSGLFPNSANEEKFFNNIKNGVDCITYGLSTDNYVASFGKLDDIYTFDSGFFNILEDDARHYDPQIRKFIEHSYSVLEKAGYANNRHNLNIALYAGTGESEYIERYGKTSQGNWGIETANGYKFLTTRTSYILNLKGMSINVNTGCSTSLVAIIQACEALVAMKCDLSIAGGVHFSDINKSGHCYLNGVAYSKSGVCSPFDVNADGMVEGNALGVVLLKRETEALKDGDNILGVITGYAINNDGREKIGYTAPSIIGQSKCIAQAQKIANVTFDDISYLECHGTGTQLGDPVEFQALKFLLNRSYSSKYCAIGSVKANIGHTIYASGVSSVIKVCKMLEHDILPPQIHFSKLNEEINFNETPFFINQDIKSWSAIAKNSRRIAGISSFGVGGTNSHIIIEDSNKLNECKIDDEDEKFYLFPISAKSQSSFIENFNQIEAYLTTKSKLSSSAYTLQDRREHFKIRSFLLKRSNNVFLTVPPVNVIYESITLVALLPGQGSQFKHMGKNLYEQHLEFRLHLDNIQAILSSFKINLLEILFDKNIDIDTTQNAQLAIFSVSYALGKVLESYHIIPECYVGHSIGEIVAATLAGVMSLETALDLVFHRGLLMNNMPKSAMISILAPRHVIENNLFGSLNIAVSNGIKNYVVSGSVEEIDLLNEFCVKNGIKSVKLRVSHGFHSSYMENAAKEFEEICKRHTFHLATKPFISNITGNWITKEEYLSPTYWADQIRKEVKFYDAIQTVTNSYSNIIFYEFGANNVLSSLTKSIDNYKTIAIIHSMGNHKSKFSEVEQLFKSIGQLWQYGIDIHWNIIYPKRTQKVDINLPTYAFDKSCLKTEYHNYNTNDFLSNNFYHCQYQNIYIDPNINMEKNLYIYFAEDSKEIKTIQTSLSNKNIIFVLYNKSKDLEFYQNTNYYCNGKEFGLSTLLNKFSGNELTISIFYHWGKIKEYSLIEHLYDWKKFFTGIRVNYSLTIISDYLDVYENFDIKQVEQCETVACFKTLSHEIKLPLRHISSNGTLNYIQIFSLGSTNSSLGDYIIKSNHIYQKSYYPIQDIVKNDLNNLQENDVVLITGGLGGIGLSLAKRLSDKFRLTFILINRSGKLIKSDSEYGIKQNELFNSIKANGSNVCLMACDVANQRSFQQLISDCYSAYGSLDMIIHAAGLPPIQGDKSYVNMQKVIGVKKNAVLGVINEIHKPLKYFLMISSLASIFYDPQRLEYNIANTYLDKFAYYQHPYIKRILTINLPNVVGIGAELRYNYEYNKHSAILENAVYEHELIDNIEKILFNTYYPHVIYSKVDPNLQLKKMGDFIEPIELNDTINNESIETQIKKILERILHNTNFTTNSNLIELGLDSLNSIQLIYVLDKLFGITLSIRNLLDMDTLQELIDLVEKEHNIKYLTLTKNGYTKYKMLPFSSLQNSLYYTHQLEGISAHYNIIFGMSYNFDIDVKRFEIALRKTLQTHRELTSMVVQDTNETLFSQIMELSIELPFFQIAYSEDITYYLEQEKTHEFLLTNEYPIRVIMIKNQLATEIIFSIHHLFFDGWSINIFLNSLQNYYNNPETIIQPDYGYAEYITFENDFLNNKGKILKFWNNFFHEINFKEENCDTYNNKTYDNAHFEILRLSSSLSNQLRNLMIKHKITDFNFFMGNFFFALNKNNAENIICTPFANRLKPEFYQTIGYFANIIPIYLASANTSWDYIYNLRDQIENITPYQTTPLSLIIELLNKRFQCNISKLLLKYSFGYFDMCNFNKFALTSPLESIYMVDPNTARFPLSLFIEKYEHEYTIKIEYNRYIITHECVLNLLQYYLLGLAQTLELPIETLLEEVEYVV